MYTSVQEKRKIPMREKHLLWKALLVIYLCSYSVNSNGQGTQAYDPEKTYTAPTDNQVKAKLSQWQDLKFGLFMHWGTYSQWGIVESWSLCPEDYPFTKRTGPYADNWFVYKQAYENLQTTFNPTHFHPEKWADAAKAAGMRYVIFTTKHHDGFCMFDSKYTDYKITSTKTPFSSNPRSNISLEIFNAFRKKDFMTGAYFSKPDWHSEDYWWSYFPPKDRHQSYDKKLYPERWQRFCDFTYYQIEELMTGYGKLDLLWLDGSWAGMDMAPIVGMARQHQPGLLVVDRHGAPEYVNYLTPEQKIPDHYIPVPWETCMTMGRSWSYVEKENYKPARQLIQMLTDIVAKNGNLLLNIGPGPEGDWHEAAYQRLADIGKWMQTNAESIYGTKPFAPYRQDKFAFTKNEKARYVSYLPAEKEMILPATLSFPLTDINHKSHIALLGATQPLKWEFTGDVVTVSIPETVQQQLAGEAVWVFKIN